ncbi:MAG: hypothetical protein R2831_10540 [Chitinophagaceae bacterium]
MVNTIFLITDKEPEEHHEEGDEGHDHKEAEKGKEAELKKHHQF